MQRASEIIGSRQPTGAPYASIPGRYPRTVTQAFRAGPDSSQQHQLMFNAFAGAEDRVAAHGDHDVGTCWIWPIPPWTSSISAPWTLADSASTYAL